MRNACRDVEQNWCRTKPVSNKMSKETWKPGHFIKKAGDKIKDAKSSLADDEPVTKADDEVTFEQVSMDQQGAQEGGGPPATAAAADDANGAADGGADGGAEEAKAEAARLSSMDMFFGEKVHGAC